MGTKNVDLCCVWVELLKNLTVWFENGCFRRAHLSRHFLLMSPFLRSLNWIFFYHKLFCPYPCNRTILLLGRKTSRMWSLFDIKAQCSSFASSMGHHFLPWCGGDTRAVRAVATLSLRWWPQLFVEHLQDFVAPCSSAMCSKRLPDAPSSMWGWHAVGMRSKGCIASAHLLGSSGEVSGKKSII